MSNPKQSGEKPQTNVSAPAPNPSNAVENQQYEEIQKRLEKDYFIVKKGPAWYFLGGIVGGLVALLGISWLTVQSKIKSEAEMLYLRHLRTSAEALHDQIEDEKEAATSARAAVQEILRETRNVPGDIERLEVALARERRLSEVEDTIAQLGRRRDKIKADSLAIVSAGSVLPAKAKKKALERALSKNKSYVETVKKIDDLSKELAELKRTT